MTTQRVIEGLKEAGGLSLMGRAFTEMAIRHHSLRVAGDRKRADEMLTALSVVEAQWPKEVEAARLFHGLPADPPQ